MDHIKYNPFLLIISNSQYQRRVREHKNQAAVHNRPNQNPNRPNPDPRGPPALKIRILKPAIPRNPRPQVQNRRAPKPPTPTPPQQPPPPTPPPHLPLLPKHPQQPQRVPILKFNPKISQFQIRAQHPNHLPTNPQPLPNLQNRS